MQASQYKYLNFVRFRDFFQWDLKRYFNQSIHSNFQIFNLGTLISEEKDKFDVSDPKTDYGILGVNNQTGIFDAYIENGSKINQKYKRMDLGWIAYNPYRINVGSIGIKRNEHKYEYISPAYVVVSCKSSLKPEYLFLTMKTPLFNKIIRENTTGSVRQNLSFEVLKNLQIPLPTLDEQRALVDAYNAKIKAAEEKEQLADKKNKEIEDYLLSELEIKKQQHTDKADSLLEFVRFKDVIEWGYDLMNKRNRNESYKYKTYKVKEICSVGSGGTPSRSCLDYYNGTIPWIKTGEVVNEEIFDTEEHISQEAIDNSSAKLYPKGSLIIAMYGQGDTRGRTAKLGIDATTNQACAVLYNINNGLVNTDYLWLYFQGRYNDLRSLASGNNQPNLNAGKISNYEVLVPPLEIQNAIVKHITELKAQIKQLKHEAKELREDALVEFEKEIFE